MTPLSPSRNASPVFQALLLCLVLLFLALWSGSAQGQTMSNEERSYWLLYSTMKKINQLYNISAEERRHVLNSMHHSRRLAQEAENRGDYQQALHWRRAFDLSSRRYNKLTKEMEVLNRDYILLEKDATWLYNRYGPFSIHRALGRKPPTLPTPAPGGGYQTPWIPTTPRK